MLILTTVKLYIYILRIILNLYIDIKLSDFKLNEQNFLIKISLVSS